MMPDGMFHSWLISGALLWKWMSIEAGVSCAAHRIADVHKDQHISRVVSCAAQSSQLFYFSLRQTPVLYGMASCIAIY
jgi:hypothetical protein